MLNRKFHIVVVDDNPGDLNLAVERLVEAPESGLDIVSAETLREALDVLAGAQVDALILDLNLPDSQGIETFRRLHALRQEIPVIIVSGAVDDELRRIAIAEGAEDVIAKDEMNNRLFGRSVLYVIERNRARLDQRRLELLLDAMPEAVLVVGAGGTVKFVNESAARLFGLPREQLFAERIGFALSSGGPCEVSITRGGEDRSCELRVTQADWDGEPVHVATLRDISARKRAIALSARSDELEASNREIQEASRLKSEFLANMSHEIRTPMNAIIGLSHLLKNTELKSNQQHLLTRIQTASRAMMEVINDILDLSKIEAGAMVLESVPLDLPELLRELDQMMAPLAEEKNLALVLRESGPMPRVIRGDVTRLRQVLTNLVGNAIKFTQRGQVELTVSSQARADGRMDLLLSVRDTGIGIAQEAQQRLFSAFSQADASTTRRFGGSGLGLSIVRRLVEMMGGSITVVSQVDVGSEFCVRIPYDRNEDGGIAGASVSRVLEVLLLAGAPAANRQLAKLVRRIGWRTEALAGLDGLAARLRERAERSEPPGVLIVDCSAGDEVQVERVRHVLAGCERAILPPCVLIRPVGPAALRKEADADATEVSILGAPSPVELFNAVSTAFLDRTGFASDVVLAPRMDALDADWLPGVRVLVVDDSEMNLEVVQRLLEREGGRVVTCESGISALERLRTGPQDFDIVLMDVQMPEMDGNETTRRLRAIPELAGLPVIALTAGALLEERQRALAAGMNDFITKPIDPDSLVRVMRRLVEQVRQAPLPIIARTKDPRTEGVAWPHIDGVDGDSAERRLGGDITLLCSMLRTLLRGSTDLVNSHARVPKDETGCRQLAARMHKLRGSAGMIGARAIHRLATEAETELRREPVGDRAQEILVELTAELRALSRHARAFLEAQEKADLLLSTSDRARMDHEDLAKLVNLLTSRDLSAVDFIKRHGGALRTWLGSSVFERFQVAMEDLNFGEAASMLEARSRELAPEIRGQ